MKLSAPKYQELLRFIIAMAILVLINIIGNQYYYRFDLTKEKRYSLSAATKELLNNLDDVVYVKIYLEGDFPAGFKRLQRATRDMLEEFKSYARGNIVYEFINPSKGTAAEKEALYKELINKGLLPTNLRVKGDEQLSERIIFPGALFYYRNKELPVHLLENQIGFSPQEVLNHSIELLEYKFANSIKKLIQRIPPTVLFSRGQGELAGAQIADIMQTLRNLQYECDTINLRASLLPLRTKVLVVAKPLQAFREQEKFKIDQFIMNGGSVLWLIDPVIAEMDSLRGRSVFLAQQRNLNLDDQFFRYGFRVNTDLLMDLQCNRIPLITGSLGNVPQTELFPWYYFPLVTPRNEHAIVRNLDAIDLHFASTIDTVGKSFATHPLRKIALLHSSPYSKALLAPVRIHFSMLREPPDPSAFMQKNLMLALLVEGKFESVFKNRLHPDFQAVLDSLKRPFRDEGVFSRMIIVGDGDVIRNAVSSSGGTYPLGYYPFTEQTFANKEFILNCIEYLADDNRLIETRNKEIRLRLLDTTRIRNEKLQWQLLNTLLPLLVVMVFGLFYNWMRKRKYAS